LCPRWYIFSQKLRTVTYQIYATPHYQKTNPQFPSNKFVSPFDFAQDKLTWERVFLKAFPQGILARQRGGWKFLDIFVRGDTIENQIIQFLFPCSKMLFLG